VDIVSDGFFDSLAAWHFEFIDGDLSRGFSDLWAVTDS